MARGLLPTLGKKYILLVGSEKMSKIMDYSDRSTCILFGDGAGAAILAESDNIYYQRCWSRGNNELIACKGVGEESSYITMNGQEVFRFAVTVLNQAVSQILTDAGLTMDDIDYCVCHQANSRIIQHVAKRFKGHEDKFYVNIERYGNTSAASIPIALDELWQEGRLKKGMKIICVGFGAGLTWSSALLQV